MCHVIRLPLDSLLKEKSLIDNVAEQRNRGDCCESRSESAEPKHFQSADSGAGPSDPKQNQ